VVPGTPDGVADDESLRERPTVVRALRSHGIAATVNAGEKDGFVANPSREQTSLGYEVGGDADGEVGPLRALGMVTHDETLLERFTITLSSHCAS
jgi:hypothetical protein